MIKKFLNLFFSALPLFGAVAGIALLYTVIHVVLSPLIGRLDASAFSAFRAPMLEEAMKYFVLWKIFDSNSKRINLLKIGLGMGLAETVINLFVVYEDMMADVRSSFAEVDAFELHLLLAFALMIKFTFSGALHALFVFAGLKFAGDKLLPAFFISVFIHWATNWIILSSAT